MARKFLYVVAGLIVLAFASTLAYRLFGADLLRLAMVPGVRFEPLPKAAPTTYADPAMWAARPGQPDDPALWTPDGYRPGANPPAAVFFIHPTTYLNRSHWNAPLDDREANKYRDLMVRSQASAFNEAGLIWAPRYRQATFGAFLTHKPEAQQALAVAYGDVLLAFDQFLKEAGDRPIILAGHSQGALHLMHLLHDRVAGTPLAKRIVAAYVVGWPVSLTADLPALGLHACQGPDDTGCILSWQSFAEPADPALILDRFDPSTGLTGQPRKDTAMLCTNPLTGKPDDAAPASANLGTLFPSADFQQVRIEPGRVPAHCGGRGLLLIGPPVDLPSFVMLGNNYHVFDYSLFWANIRADASRRVAAFQQQTPETATTARRGWLGWFG